MLKPALESYNPSAPLPHLIDHQDIIAGQPFAVKSPNCIVLLNPTDDDIQPFKRDLSNRYPAGDFKTFTNPSNTTSVEIFVPVAG